MLNSLLAHMLYTPHASQSGGRGLSPALWSRARDSMQNPDGTVGAIMFSDDFTNFAMNQTGDASAALTFPSIEGVGSGGYHCYLDIGASATPLQTDTAADWGGVVRLIGGDTDDDVAVLNTPEFLGYDVANSAERMIIFEARVRLTNVADGSAFIGLGSSEMRAVNGLIASNGAPITTANCIGFNVIEDDPDGWDFIHQAASVDDVRTASMQNAVASTWYKLGFIIDPLADAAERVQIFVDNVKKATFVTGAVVEGTTFPADVGLGLVAIAHTETAATHQKVLDIDWWAAYQGGATG